MNTILTHQGVINLMGDLITDISTFLLPQTVNIEIVDISTGSSEDASIYHINIISSNGNHELRTGDHFILNDNDRELYIVGDITYGKHQEISESTYTGNYINFTTGSNGCFVIQEPSSGLKPTVLTISKPNLIEIRNPAEYTVTLSTTSPISDTSQTTIYTWQCNNDINYAKAGDYINLTTSPYKFSGNGRLLTDWKTPWNDQPHSIYGSTDAIIMNPYDATNSLKLISIANSTMGPHNTCTVINYNPVPETVYITVNTHTVVNDYIDEYTAAYTGNWSALLNKPNGTKFILTGDVLTKPLELIKQYTYNKFTYYPTGQIYATGFSQSIKSYNAEIDVSDSKGITFKVYKTLTYNDIVDIVKSQMSAS